MNMSHTGLKSNRAYSAERLGLVAQTEPEQPNRLLGQTEPSPSDRVMPPSKPNRACTATEPSQADSPPGPVRPNQARAADWAAQPNRAEPERQGHATEQAELSMQATEPSPSGPSARFARFDSRPGHISC